MNPRVSRSERARVQGDRLSDREDRGEAGGRLSTRRVGQRHHRDERGVRADDRLRGREVAAVCVREVSRRRSAADDPDEVGGRGDEHRAHVQASATEGRTLARDRTRWPGLAPRSSVDYRTLVSQRRARNRAADTDAMGVDAKPSPAPPVDLPPPTTDAELARGAPRAGAHSPFGSRSGTSPTRCGSGSSVEELRTRRRTSTAGFSPSSNRSSRSSARSGRRIPSRRRRDGVDALARAGQSATGFRTARSPPCADVEPRP